MLDNKGSLGVIIISWLEIIVGALMLLVSGSITILNILSSPSGKLDDYTKISHDNGTLAGIMFVAVSCFILSTGILTSKLKSAGRMLNFLLSGCCIFFYILWFLLSPTSIQDLREYILTSNGLVIFGPLYLSIFSIWFFNLPEVKEQFKPV